MFKNIHGIYYIDKRVLLHIMVDQDYSNITVTNLLLLLDYLLYCIGYML